MQSTNSSMNFPLQFEGVLSQTGRENRVLCCLLAFIEVRRPSFLTRNVFLVIGACHTRYESVFKALSSLELGATLSSTSG